MTHTPLATVPCAWFPWAPRPLFAAHGVEPELRVEDHDDHYLVRVHLPDAIPAARVGLSFQGETLHLTADHLELTEDLGGARLRTRVAFEHSLRLPGAVGLRGEREAHGRELVVRLRRGGGP
ncbi:MAG: hypothetical protein AB7N76_32190 [Planctomycetota bacterium]